MEHKQGRPEIELSGWSSERYDRAAPIQIECWSPQDVEMRVCWIREPLIGELLVPRFQGLSEP